MKAVFTYPTLVRDGAEGITINIESLAEALRRRGAGVDVRGPEVCLKDLNRKSTHLFRGLQTVPHVWRGLARGDADIVHFHASLPSQAVLALLGRATALGSSRPLIGHLWNAFVEENDLRNCHSPLEAMSHRALNNRGLASLGLNALQAVIVTSRYQVEQLRQAGYNRPIYRIPNGVDLARFRPTTVEQRIEERQRLGLPAGPIVLYYGHLTPWKGVLHLVRGFGAVAREHPDATLVIARTGYGSEEPLLRQTLQEMGIADRALFLGKTDPAALARCADVGVVPAIASVGTAVYANVLLEQMAAGLPVVATGIGTTSEVIVDGVNGLLVPPADSGSMGCALNRLLDDGALRASLSQAARRTSEMRFDWNVVASAVHQAYLIETERVASPVPQPIALRD